MLTQGQLFRRLAVMIGSMMLMLSVVTVPSSAATTSTLHSISISQLGATAEIVIDVTIAPGDVSSRNRYQFRVLDEYGRPNKGGDDGSVELTAGRQTLRLTTTGLTRLTAGSYGAYLKLFNGGRFLYETIDNMVVTDGSIPPEPPTPEDPSSLDPTLKRYVSGLPTNSNVGLSDPVSSLRKPTASNLPAGASVGSTKRGPSINVTGNGATLQGWDFSGYVVNVSAANVTLKDNLFGEQPGVSGHFAYLVINQSANNLTVENNDFMGFDGEGGAGMAIFHKLSTSAATGLTVRFNRFENLGSDGIKLSGEGATVEWNAFMLARNVNAVPTPWSATRTYNIGDYALNAKGHLFKSRVNRNRGVNVPSGKSTTSQWQSLDPHVDHITLLGAKNGASIRYNYFSSGDLTDRVLGTTNSLRLLRNTNTSYLVETVVVQGNFIQSNPAVLPHTIQISSGGQPNFNGPIQLRHNWIGGQFNSKYVRVDSGNVVWDNNVDATTNSPIDAPALARTVNTGAPKASVAPAAIRTGHSG